MPRDPGPARPRVGTAGWAVPSGTRRLGTHLEHYSRLLSCAEINSSFYRPHARATYERWAASTPDGFRFAVKVPREITHERRLVGTRDVLDRFLDESAGLGTRRGPLLVQLPPSFAYSGRTAGRFLTVLRARYDGLVVVEPRHPSWFSPAAGALLTSHGAGRVGADPPTVPGGGLPAGWPGVRYFRLHGSPRMYWSAYAPAALSDLTTQLEQAADSGAEVWCIFDNTSSGAAFPNALFVHEQLLRGDRRRGATSPDPRGVRSASARAV